MHSLCAGVSSPDDSTPGTFGFPEGFLPDLGLRTDRAVNPPLRSEVSALIDAARGENCPGCLAQGARSGSRRSCPTLFDAGHPAMVSKFAHYLRRSFRGEENRLPTIVSQPSASAKHRLATRGLSPGRLSSSDALSAVGGATDFVRPPSFAQLSPGNYWPRSEPRRSLSTRRLVKTGAESADRCDSSGQSSSSSCESSRKSIQGAEVVSANTPK